MPHRLRITVPADHHVEFELPAEIAGEVEIVITPVVTTGVTAEQAAKRAAFARKIRERMPKNTGDSTDLIREERGR